MSEGGLARKEDLVLDEQVAQKLAEFDALPIEQRLEIGRGALILKLWIQETLEAILMIGFLYLF